MDRAAAEVSVGWPSTPPPGSDPAAGRRSLPAEYVCEHVEPTEHRARPSTPHTSHSEKPRRRLGVRRHDPRPPPQRRPPRRRVRRRRPQPMGRRLQPRPRRPRPQARRREGRGRRRTVRTYGAHGRELQAAALRGRRVEECPPEPTRATGAADGAAARTGALTASTSCPIDRSAASPPIGDQERPSRHSSHSVRSASACCFSRRRPPTVGGDDERRSDGHRSASLTTGTTTA